MYNLRNRSFLKEIDFSRDELLHLLRLSEALKDGQVRRQRGPAAGRQGDRADLREDLDPHPLRVRGRRLRPGRPRHLPRPDRVADRPQGVDRRHRAGARAACSTRSSTAARARRRRGAGRSTPACPVYNGLTNEWHPTQMLADFLTMHEHASGAIRGDRLRVRRRRPLQHGPLAAHQPGRSSARTCGSSAPTELRPPADVVEMAQRARRRTRAPRSRSPTTPGRRRGRRLRPYRRLGLDG